jgi:TetR/AcrR family transcriptional regulator, regulator of cefoperazone and chloramphenicol sensitivity
LHATEQPFSLLNMRSVNEEMDPSGKAAIRDAALRLFAESGPDGVTVREIAAAAEVSPALILHHFGSKDGLREAIDAQVAGMFDDMLEALGNELSESMTEPGSTSLVEALAAGFPPDSPLPAYLRRLLLTGDQAGHDLFKRWYADTVKVMDELVASGVGRPGANPAVRAALLLSNDLGLILLRPFLEAVTGLDPLSKEGALAFVSEAVLMYTEGAFQTPIQMNEEQE